ncbi:V-type ATP synthase subunit D, partial [Clostridioides difficile]|uniref:V-type ATP synthase subunit D n=1 Tax=Clostridioides difficile TaxID=1496 RepID=UPI002350D7F0
MREEAENALATAYKNFIIARAVMSQAYLGSALIMPKQSVSVDVSTRNIMSVDVPVFKYKTENNQSDMYPYGVAGTTDELDSAMKAFSDAMRPPIRLEESDKSAQLLAQEIEKTRGRVK